jgi:hypothetical protein
VGKLKSGLGALAGLVIFAGLMLVAVLVLKGMEWVFERIFPWILRGEILLLFLCIVSLPFAFFRRTRPFPAITLTISNNVFWLGLWVLGFLIVYDLWGLVGLVIGLLLGGVGVVPLAALAALTKGAWPLLETLGLAFLFAMLVSIAAAWLSATVERDAQYS